MRETIAQDHARLTKLMQMSGELRKEQMIMLYEVELKKLDSVKVLSLRGIIPQYNQENILWEKLGAYLTQNNIACRSGGRKARQMVRSKRIYLCGQSARARDHFAGRYTGPEAMADRAAGSCS